MVRHAVQLLVVAGLAGGTLRGANDSFVGTWKLNASMSTLTDQMKIQKVGTNTYALVFGIDAETIVADGTDQPGLFGTTVSIGVMAPTSWTVIRKKRGHTLLTGLWILSKDGKILTDHFTAFRPDGSKRSVDYVYTRTAGNAGFPGTWESTTEKMTSVYELEIRPLDGDGLAFVTSDQHTTQDMRFDGKDYPKVGPDVIAGTTSSGRWVNERTLDIADKIEGTVVATRHITLSPDRKTLKMTVYPTGHSKPNILVFDRKTGPPARTESVDSIDLSAVGKDARWKVVGRTASMVDVKGKHALALGGSSGDGIAWLDGYDFGNGVIEVDLLGRSEPFQGSFLGIAFRVADSLNTDLVYLRPFNFRAADSARHSHAVQYVSQPSWPWNRLRAEHPGKYESAVSPAPDGDEWFHVRVVVAHPTVSVFVNGAAQPTLVVDELSDRAHGAIGVWADGEAPGLFANLRVTRTR